MPSCFFLPAVSCRDNTGDKRLETIDKRLETIDERLETIDKRLETVDEKLKTVDRPGRYALRATLSS
jgi:archaellum component FlaC